MKKWMMLLVLVLIMNIGSGCSSETSKETAEKTTKEIPSATRELFAMDTYMSLSASGERAEEALSAAEEEIKQLENLLNAENTESEIYIVNENGSEYLSEDTANLINRSLELYESTKGCFDITIYPLMVEWGFTTKDYKVPEEQKIQELLKNVGSSKITYDKEEKFLTLPDGVQIDLGGIAKGYTSNRIMEIYEEYDIVSGLVSLGGNVQVYKRKTDGSLYKVAIESPDETSDYVGVLKVEDKAVITSGGYERNFEKDGQIWHHILNPETGYPAQSGLTSVTIVSEDGTMADGLSTALFVMGKEKALAYWKQNADKFDVILVEEDGSITITQGLDGFFSSEQEFSVENQ